MLPRTLGVVGAGQMGCGIAQCAAMAGFDVLLYDASFSAVQKATGSIKAALQRLADKHKITLQDAELAQHRIKFAHKMEALCDSHTDFIVEAATEHEQLKGTIFRSLDQIMPANVILASNTSSISITRIAAQTERPNKVVGLHFMNPVPVMRLVEVIRGMHTSDETFAAARAVALHMGKVLCVSQDRPGFIINRVLMVMINEAFFALMEGVASAQDIDNGMRLGTNQPMGPLELADFIGLDTCLAIMRVLHEGMGDKYRPCPLLVQYVAAGWFGKKQGQGVYSYRE